MLKPFKIVLVLICFHSFGQTELVLTEQGDSSTILTSINDKYAYISFTDPNNINKGIDWQSYMESNLGWAGLSQNKPRRSFMLVEYHFQKDKIVLTEVFGKRYINPSIEYSSFETKETGKLVILFEGKESIGDNYLNAFDSLFLEINNNIYIGDLNTTIFYFETSKPKSKKFKVRIYDNRRRIDYETTVKLRKNINRFFLKFELIESQFHSLMAQDYLKSRIPNEILKEGKNYQLEIEFIDWMHYWQFNEIKYD